ncbi:MAG: energy transducer TonB [Acidobacteriaceae bacterium]
MTLKKQILTLISATLLCAPSIALCNAQQTTAASAGVTAASTPSPVSDAALLKSTAPLSEDALRAKYAGKLIFLRGSYLGDNLEFDTSGKVNGSPTATSFTLSAFEVRKVKLSKHTLELEGDRYGLHFLGALPYEDQTQAFDKVKISKKPVRISIEREVIVIPKVKKEKKKKAPSAQELAAAQTLKTRNDTPAGATNTASTTGAPEAAKPVSAAAADETNKALAAVSPEHSAMVMNKALDTIFADDIDPRMMSHLPDYWQEYFNSKSQRRPFMPSDASIKAMSDGMTPPKVLNAINPDSNEYAQEYGIAGMEMVRTVVDANGMPRQMAIARPIGFGLDEKAVDAVKHSHFTPATLNGRPVPVVVDLVVTFRIYSNLTRPGSVGKGATNSVLAASVADTDATLGR